MPDFLITHVQYDEERNHIDNVKICVYNYPIDKKQTVGKTYIIPAGFIRDLLRTKKVDIKTATKNKDNALVVGELVSLYGEKYITTNPNNKSKDNLGNLPEF